jgi:hypothetical protein
MDAKEPSPEDLDAVLQFLPALEALGANTGTWAGREVQPDGALTMPYLVPAPAVEALRTALYEHGMTLVFDWPDWQDEAARYTDDPAALATADLEVLRKLLTVHVRKDRFREGHFAGAVAAGHIPAILRRLREITRG